MTAIGLRNVHGGALHGVELRVDGGLHVVLGSLTDGTDDLVRVLSGTLRPARGHVSLAGRHPYGDPVLRRRLATLLAHEPVIDSAPVARTLERWSALIGQPLRSSPWIEEIVPDPVTKLPHSSLSDAQRRTLALGVALAIESPVACVLHEPLWAAAERIDRVAEAIQQRATVVPTVVCTASTEHANRLGGTFSLLRRGIIVGDVANLRSTSAGAELSVGTPEARRLCALLAEQVGVLQVRLEAATDRVTIRGDDLESLAALVARLCRSHEIVLRYLAPRTVPLAELHATVAGTRAVARGANSHVGARHGG